MTRRRGNGSTSAGRSTLWRAGALSALVVGPLAGFMGPGPVAGAAGSATVQVAFSAASKGIDIPAPATGPGVTDSPVLAGAVFTLETGSGPDPAGLTPTASSCTTDATGACTLTATAAGTFWVVETSTPARDAPSQPVQVNAVLTHIVTASVTLVPDDCTAPSTGATGTCAFTFFFSTIDGPPSAPTPHAIVVTGGDHLENLGTLGYSYDPTTHVLTLQAPGTTVPPPTTFNLCYGPLDMTFGIMVPANTYASQTHPTPRTPLRPCEPGGTGILETQYGAHETTYTSEHPMVAASTPSTTYSFIVPSGVYWFLDVTCGEKMLQVADPAPTPSPPPVIPTLSTTASALSVTVGTPVTDSATVTGTAPDGAPTGTVTFSVCGPTASDQVCSPTGANTVGAGPVPLSAGTGAASTATSASFSPSATGTWCVAAVYTPASGSPYGTASDDVTGTAVAAECLTVTTIAPARTSGTTSAPQPAEPAPATVTAATTVSTGMPWAGSRPFVLGGAALGAGMVALGLGQRRRSRRLARARR